MNGLLISDFNIQNLASYLKNTWYSPGLDGVKVSYGQAIQTLMDDTAEEWSVRPDFTVVWTRPEGVLEGFSRLLGGHEVELDRLLQQVDRYAEQLIVASRRTGALFVPLWTAPACHPGHGLLTMGARGGVTRALMRANLRLVEDLESQLNVFPLASSKWIELVGGAAYNARLWYLGKIPFANEVFKAAARDIRAAMLGISGRARKVVICDLDETLWGGIVGDDGWQRLVLGGHDAAGEALVDFQKELKALARRGILLAIVSKNEEQVALEAICRHPEMVLRKEDFAGWRINWKDKAENIVDLMAELNLGLDSAVFLDDNPVERGRVREALPEVLVPEWPADKKLYPQALLALDCFDRPSVTSEDRQRVEMYKVERERKELRESIGSLDGWLRSLEIAVRVGELSEANLTRAAQLLNKTNQMNLSTRRMTESELMAWSQRTGNRLWAVQVSDKFGDYGLTGLLGLSACEGAGRVEDFVLSCRVMGRKVEETMLYVAVEWAKEMGLSLVRAVYQKTAKNKPCREFFASSGFEEEAEDCYAWRTERDYPRVEFVKLEWERRPIAQA